MSPRRWWLSSLTPEAEARSLDNVMDKHYPLKQCLHFCLKCHHSAHAQSRSEWQMCQKTGLRNTDKPIIPVYHPTWPTAFSASFHTFTFHTQFSAAGGGGKCQLSIMNPVHDLFVRKVLNAIVIVFCPDSNVLSAGTFHRGFHALFQNFHRAAGREPGMLLPFVSEAVFFFIACHAQRSSPGVGGSSGAGGA